MHINHIPCQQTVRELIEPLNKLNKEVKEAAKDTNVEYKSQIRTGDEIEELSKTFEDTMGTLAMQVNNVQYAMKKSDKAAQERIAFEEKSKLTRLRDFITGRALQIR